MSRCIIIAALAALAVMGFPVEEQAVVPEMSFSEVTSGTNLGSLSYTDWTYKGTSTPIKTPVGWEEYITAKGQKPLCGTSSQSLNSGSAGDRKSIDDCAATCSSTNKCSFFTFFEDKGCLLFEYCQRGKVHSWAALSKNFRRKPVPAVYVASSAVPLMEASKTTTSTVEQKLDKLIKMQATNLWLEDGVWDESFRQTGRLSSWRGIVAGTIVKFNGYACQAFGPDGPANPLQHRRNYNSRHLNGGKDSWHNTATFTIPAGMFVPSASMPGLERLNQMLGKYSWNSDRLVVASSSGNDYNYVYTRGADQHIEGKTLKDVHGGSRKRGTASTNINTDSISKGQSTRPVIHQSGRQYKLNNSGARLVACGRTVP